MMNLTPLPFILEKEGQKRNFLLMAITQGFVHYTMIQSDFLNTKLGFKKIVGVAYLKNGSFS